MSQRSSKKLNDSDKPRDNRDCDLVPGALVRHSGLYEICHADEDRAIVVFRKDEIFPACRRCGDSVRYKLLHAARHISEDPDFSDPGHGPGKPPEEIARSSNQFPRQLGPAHGFRYWQSPL